MATQTQPRKQTVTPPADLIELKVRALNDDPNGQWHSTRAVVTYQSAENGFNTEEQLSFCDSEVDQQFRLFYNAKGRSSSGVASSKQTHWLRVAPSYLEAETIARNKHYESGEKGKYVRGEMKLEDCNVLTAFDQSVMERSLLTQVALFESILTTGRAEIGEDCADDIYMCATRALASAFNFEYEENVSDSLTSKIRQGSVFSSLLTSILSLLESDVFATLTKDHLFSVYKALIRAMFFSTSIPGVTASMVNFEFVQAVVSSMAIHLENTGLKMLTHQTYLQTQYFNKHLSAVAARIVESDILVVKEGRVLSAPSPTLLYSARVPKIRRFDVRSLRVSRTIDLANSLAPALSDATSDALATF